MKVSLTCWILTGVVFFSLLLFPAGVTEAQPDFFDLQNLTERTEGYLIMRDRADGKVILRTARILREGNEFIDEKNRHYRVVEVVDDTAWVERIDTSGAGMGMGKDNMPISSSLPLQGQEENGNKVGIYHSHGAESYVPSDGEESIDEGGGIIDVGETLAQSLREKGVETVHEQETHVPHDAGAYIRSRRTAEELLVSDNVDYLFDVHRDAVPAEEYEEEVEGERVTKILLVVGQQNQNMENNMQFARDLKSYADENYPGLVKGILAAPGSYNQDLHPRAILLEVGAHENRKEDAENGAEKFASVINAYITGDASAPGAGQEGGIALASVLRLLAVLIAALFIYLLVAAGSWEEFKRKITTFFKKEFADLGRRIGGGRNGGEEDER